MRTVGGSFQNKLTKALGRIPGLMRPLSGLEARTNEARATFSHEKVRVTLDVAATDTEVCVVLQVFL